MKLFGNSSKKRKHKKTANINTDTVNKETSPKRTPEELREIEAQIAAYQKFKMKKRIIILSILVVIIVGAVILWKINIKPPERSSGGILNPSADSNVQSNTPTQNKNNKDGENAATIDAELKAGCYTFLVVGCDNGYGNTDTILVGMLDTGKGELNILSIPRDTMVNVSWATKKVNTLYSYSGVEGLMSGIGAIMGYELDHYAIVDLNAFMQIVDTIGGVWFDVPQDMLYTAEDQNPPLYINLKKGYQLLDGEHAMQAMRFRAGYSNADIGRIGTQQAFLKAMAKQCIDLGNVFKIDDFVKIFKENVDTSLTDGNILWYAKTVLGLDSDKINFYTLPENYNDSVKGGSYCSINIDEWLELLNDKFNPWDFKLTVDNLDILTRDANHNLYATTGTIRGGTDSFFDFNAYLGRGSSGGSSSSGTSSGTTPVTEVPEAPQEVVIPEQPHENEGTNPEGETQDPAVNPEETINSEQPGNEGRTTEIGTEIGGGENTETGTGTETGTDPGAGAQENAGAFQPEESAHTTTAAE